MRRRTFIQGTAASLAMLQFATARGQEQKTGSPNESPTEIYTDSPTLLQEPQFNPLADHSREGLYNLHLPFPDPKSPLYPIWQKVFSPPLNYISQSRLEEETLDYQLNLRPDPELSVITTRWEGSQNWSGAYIEARNGNMFTEASGSWTIPDLSSLRSHPLYASSSIWVGLDGQRLYFNSSLPQIGTTQRFKKSGAIDYHAWYQWWEREPPSSPASKRSNVPKYIGLKLTAHDLVFCDVQVVNLTHVIVSIAVFGTPIKFWSKKLTAPISAVTGTMPHISGATAQWIVERPTVPGTSNLLPLVDYGQVGFTDCIAVGAPAPAANAAEYQTLNSARFIRMYERLNGPSRTKLLSNPSRLVPDQQRAFKVTYAGR